MKGVEYFRRNVNQDESLSGSSHMTLQPKRGQ